MKILHIAISRGWHAQIANAFLTIQHQAKKGYIQNVFTLEDSKLAQKLEMEIPLISVTTIEHYNSPNLVSKLIYALMEDSPDAVHIHGLNGKLRLLLALWLANKELPIVCSSRDKLESCTKFSQHVFTRYSQVIVPNQFVGDKLQNGIKRDFEMEIVAPPVDVEKFKPIAKTEQDSIRIGMFARFDEVKDYPVFFDACRILNEKIPELEIIVAGANFRQHRQEIHSMIEYFGLKKKTTLLGRIPSIETEIAKLDIGVISSNGSEEISRIALEYMSCGIPVVSTAVGGLPELITPDVGILVRPGSAEKLAQGIQQLAMDKELRQSMALKAREKVLKENAINVYCEKLHKFYITNPFSSFKSKQNKEEWWDKTVNQ